jgi:hypothetical protein
VPVIPVTLSQSKGRLEALTCHCEHSEAIALKSSCHVIEKLIGFAVITKLISGDRLTNLLWLDHG